MNNLPEVVNFLTLKNKNCPNNCNSLLVGKHTLICMECGQIKLEFKKKSDFKKLMNPTIQEKCN